jgi:hypothetical protein
MSTSKGGQATEAFNWAIEREVRQRKATKKLIFFILVIFKGRNLVLTGR